ncbi:hypothetical protein M0805_001091 [Coniferiporia weirii]|nr:hypothetical protein M0805_001091 [Coniferiporia weirii]
MTLTEEAPPATTVTALTSRSPMAQLLSTLGLTREDLLRHASQMRDFLDSEDAESARAPSEHPQSIHRQSSETPSHSRGRASTRRLHEETAQGSTRSGDRAATPTPPPPPSSATHRLRASSHRLVAHRSEDLNYSSKRSARKSKEDQERRRARAIASPSRPKPSLDEIMQMRSRQSLRVSESEESEDSGDESLRDVFAKRQSKPPSPRYRYPHPSRTQQVGGDYYKQESSPAVPINGNYYRTCDTSQKHDGLSISSPTPTTRTNSYYRQPYDLPPSSPILPSSPMSSPPRRAVNLVSSPGPMSDPPDQYDEDLPYALPPGPYSGEKPDLSYAALIGQAILASPYHALRLKDIYDYISIVHPFFKRDGHSHSQKWMNAIRQNLTNTPQFFKREDPSGKPSKGSLWCISDENLPCFANGGYNRHALNPDSVQSVKAEKRKRKKEEKQRDEKTKKVRVAAIPNPYTFPYGYPQAARPLMYAQSTEAVVQADIIFPPLPANHPNAHLVNRALSSSESLDEDVIFPPLPAYSQTRIVREQRMQELSRQSSSSSLTQDYSQASSQVPSDDESSPISAPPMSSASSSASVPDLTPNNSSSSPPEPDEEDGESEFMYINEDVSSEAESTHEEDEPDPIWKGKGKVKDEDFSFPDLPPMPSSPTAYRKGTQLMRSPSTSLYAGSGFLGYSRESGSGSGRPSTPPNGFAGYLESSLTMTPLARREPPATPTRNTGQRKASKSADEGSTSDDHRPNFLDAVPRTPSRRPAELSSGPLTLPATPRRIFSPFGTFSPFRTPSRRGIFDPADPGTMLEEELSALASAKQRGPQDSPVGFFPRGKGFLYESPNLPSPDKWKPW